MYLVVIIVPIYADGDRTYVTTEWKRSLELLRDSLEGRYGPIAVLAPLGDAERSGVDQRLEPVDADHDGVVLYPSIPERCRSREYWARYRKQWLADSDRLVAQADVVHSGADDLYRPRMYDAWKLAVRRGVPTVFVQDTDVVVQIPELAADRGVAQRLKAAVYCRLYEQTCRRGVRESSLSLLKGTGLMRRYGRFARNAKEFHDTSYDTAEITSPADLEARVASLQENRPLRFVYCGRLIPRKGVLEGLATLAEARRRGAQIELDIIGDGPQRDDVAAALDRLALRGAVRMRGSLPYGPQLLGELARYDALYFTPTAEDTPRMIFDGYAAALPLVATSIDYCQERSQAEEAAVLLPRHDQNAAADLLVGLSRNRAALGKLAKNAHAAAFYHAADQWYARRAAWTFEAVDRARSRGDVCR